jgi:hypothetical protein
MLYKTENGYKYLYCTKWGMEWEYKILPAVKTTITVTDPLTSLIVYQGSDENQAVQVSRNTVATTCKGH